MVADFRYIIASEDGFKNKKLDDLLAKGFYRMQHLMFTCNQTAINYETFTIPVFWLRTLVQEVKLTKNASNILKKCSAFNVNITDAFVDDEIEALDYAVNVFNDNTIIFLGVEKIDEVLNHMKELQSRLATRESVQEQVQMNY